MVNTMQHTNLQARRSPNEIAAMLDGAAPLLAEHPNDAPLALFVLGAAGEALVSGVTLPDTVRAWLNAAPSPLLTGALHMAIVEAEGLVLHLARRDDDAGLRAEGRAAELLAALAALAWRLVRNEPDGALAAAMDRLAAALAPWGNLLVPPPPPPGAAPDDTAVDAWLRKGEGDAAIRAYAAEHPEFAEDLRMLVACAVEDYAAEPEALPLWPGAVANPV